MKLSVPNEAKEIKNKLVSIIQKDQDEFIKSALTDLIICINAVEQLDSRRHLEILLPQAIQKAVRAIDTYKTKVQ
ncbi:hypothetical protein [Pseudomonas sp. PDM08]|uniref:hypothetical protein n=1 Tax=Pseudomonas sp. PDM08 TaxID=2769265 RepID=UPI0017816EF9|nr:hypothetical protein [Pseudomonas sp. PDM08]MBD9609540.1 hypothetical protein [Pseudomonas sp. PDM08]